MHDNSIRMGDYDDERYCWNHFQSDYFPGNKLFKKIHQTLESSSI